MSSANVSIPMPPSPIDPQEFCESFQEDIANIEFYEMIEGTRIHVYYEDDCWCHNSDEITMRGFKDACDALHIDLEHDLDNQFSYSFVFQTPYHKYVNSFLHSYEIYLVALYRTIDNNVVSCNLRDVTAYKCRDEQPCYKNNTSILIPDYAAVNFNDLQLIVKEWGVGNGLPIDILDNDDYDRHAFIHDRKEKGIEMCHIPSGTTCQVLNRHYLKFISKQNQKNISKV